MVEPRAVFQNPGAPSFQVTESYFVFLPLTTPTNSHINTEITSFCLCYLEGNIFLNVRSTAREQITKSSGNRDLPNPFAGTEYCYTRPLI